MDQRKEVKYMGKKKIAGIILLVVGIALVVLSLIIDLVGIGQTPTFGWNQTVGTIVGAIVILGGIVLMFIPEKS